MFCPKCASEFRPGVTFCKNCELDLVAEPPQRDAFDDESAMANRLSEKDLEAVVVGAYAAVREHQAALAKLRIPSIIAPEDENAEVQPGMHQRLYLLVAAEDLEKVHGYFTSRLARGLAVEGLMKEGTAVPAPAALEGDALPCPACGAAVPANAEECPDCGLGLGAVAE